MTLDKCFNVTVPFRKMIKLYNFSAMYGALYKKINAITKVLLSLENQHLKLTHAFAAQRIINIFFKFKSTKLIKSKLQEEIEISKSEYASDFLKKLIQLKQIQNINKKNNDLYKNIFNIAITIPGKYTTFGKIIISTLIRNISDNQFQSSICNSLCEFLQKECINLKINNNEAFLKCKKLITKLEKANKKNTPNLELTATTYEKLEEILCDI